jgi:hypothetical protein
MNFKLRGGISEVKEIAAGKLIRILPVLQKLYGKGRWRKLKGLLWWHYRMAALTEQSYTGTRLMASGVGT